MSAHYVPLLSGPFVIKSFRSRALKRYWDDDDAGGIRADHLKRLHLRLSFLDKSRTPQDMDVPGWRFHALAGRSKGRYAVRVTGNWRLTFAWDGTDAIEVDFEDYH